MEKHFGSINQLMKHEETKGERIALLFMIFIATVGGFIIFISRSQITKIAQLAFGITLPLFIVYCITEYFMLKNFKKYRYSIKFISSFLFGFIVFLNLLVLFGYRTYKTPIFSLFYLLIGLGALRYSARLSLFSTFISSVFIFLLVIISILTKNVQFGNLQESYISNKVSLLWVIVNSVFMIMLGIIQYYIAERYRFVMRQSLVFEVDKIKKENEVNQIKTMFSRYVSMQVAEMLINNKHRIVNEKKYVTVLFCDIKDFTKISEEMEANEVVKMLNRFFSVMIEIIFYFHGTLDKFIGDALMAVFGAPISEGNDEINAVCTAIAMRKALILLNEENKLKGYPSLNFRIGIDSGDAIAGNIGSEKRMEYTVIGHTVNCASRIEQSNKIFNTDILITKNTYDKIKDYLDYEKMPPLIIKGIEEKIETYHVKRIRYDYLEINQKIENSLKSVFT